ncbi:hypothetical protein ACWD4O_39080 [Streptomyces sp. NPDC002623]
MPRIDQTTAEEIAHRVTLADGRRVISLTGPDEAPGNQNEEVRGYTHPDGTGFVVTGTAS